MKWWPAIEGFLELGVTNTRTEPRPWYGGSTTKPSTAVSLLSRVSRRVATGTPSTSATSVKARWCVRLGSGMSEVGGEHPRNFWGAFRSQRPDGHLPPWCLGQPTIE